MVSSRATLCTLVLIACTFFPFTDADDVMCINMQYAGPIKDAINTKATKLVDATLQSAKEGEELAVDLVGQSLEVIPFVGYGLAAMFKILAFSFGLGGGLDLVDVYKSLHEEIAQLRRYMDQEIVELKLDQIRNKFGTDRGGMLSYAKHCVNTYKEDPDDMSTCLENLRAMLVQQYHFFLPEDEKATSYEQTLPLFRMYGQLYVDTLLDQIHVAKKRGKESQAVAHAKALIARVEEFTRHAQNSVEKIVKYQVQPHVMPKDGNPSCAPLGGGYQFCVCTIAIGPSKFDKVDAKGNPTDKTKNYCIGITYGYPACTYAVDGYKRKYMLDHAKAIVAYWKTQLGDVVDAWGKIVENLKPMVENHKKSLSLPERIKFERDVAAVIAKEKRLMQKRAHA